jgi:hypothetical protein
MRGLSGAGALRRTLMKPIARILSWATGARHVFAMNMWTDFVRTLEDTIREESVFDGGNAWQVVRERPCYISLNSATCPSFGVDVEFSPSSHRVECVFKPVRNVRVFELRYWTSSTAPREVGMLRIRPRRLAVSLVDMICFAGMENPPG